MIVVEWDEATGCGGVEDLDCHYQLTVTEHENLKEVKVKATEYTLYRPITGIRYCFEVTPCNACGFGLPTQPLCVHHEGCTTPIAVGLPVIASQDEKQIYVTWDPTPMTDRYLVSYSIDSLREFEEEVSSPLEYLVPDPIPGSVYCFRVYPVNDCGQGLSSATVCSDSCTLPQNLALPRTEVTEDNIAVRLDECMYDGGIYCHDCFYDLAIKRKDEPLIPLGPSDQYLGRGYNLKVDQGDCGRTYYISARCGNICGYSDAYPIELVYDCDDFYCDAPVEVLDEPTLVSSSPRAISISWTRGPCGADCRYNVSYRNSYRNLGDFEVAETTTPSFELTNPDAGAYIFCVSLVNDCGVGPYSRCLGADVAPCDRPEPPTVLVSEVQCQVKIEWFDSGLH
jgi:hypothetical protein